MARLEIRDFEFREEEDKVKFVFMKYYHFFVDKSEIGRIGDFKVYKEYIEFDASERSITNKINRILDRGMNELTSILGKPTVFIHKDSGIPLLGTNEFGIVDRDTNIIEVKAHTLCNLDCIYCSVDAGKSSKKTTDFLVDADYLVEEFEKISSIKKKPVEASINPQGEPLMYSRIIDLVKGLKACKCVKIVSMNTNGVLLTERLVDDLIKAGLDRINLSLNTLDQHAASKLAGSVYPLEKVKEIIKYCDEKIDLIIAPLIVPGYNDNTIKELIEFCKSLKNLPVFGFQNFLEYKRGRNPVKSKGMEWFEALLREHEDESGVKLLCDAEYFNISHDEKIPKPFRKNEMINAEVMSKGKYPNEFIAVSDNRCVTITGRFRIGDKQRIRIVRDKHNIFRGIPT